MNPCPHRNRSWEQRRHKSGPLLELLHANGIPAGRIYRAAWPLLDISSSRIRELLATGGDIRYLVPDAVVQYITQQQIYKGAHEQKTKPY